MGASQSTQAQPSTTSQMTAEEMQLKQIEQSMPRYSRPETFDEKLYRKVSDSKVELQERENRVIPTCVH